MNEAKMFPIQTGGKPVPSQIPWSIAEKAYGVYSGKYGTSQTLKRLAERGGFGAGEMDLFYPAWREECSEIHHLRASVTELKAVLTGWLSIAQRQLDSLLLSAEAENQGEALINSQAWKAACKRIERMQAALKA